MNQALKNYIEIKNENAQQDSSTKSSFGGQETQMEEIQTKELSSPCSDGILLTYGEEFKEEAWIKPKKPLRSTIRRFFASYYELTTAASVLRQRVIFMVSIFVCSNFALENKNTEKVIPILFGAAYFCLSYQIFENFIQFRYLKTANSGFQKMECMFAMANKALLLFFAVSLNLLYYGVIHQIWLLLTPLLLLLELRLYWKNLSRLEAQGRDDMKAVEKAFYLIQSFMIAAKMNNFIDFKWETTLIFFWVYLGAHAACVILTALMLGLVISASIMSLDTETLCLVKSKILGYIWHISYFGFNVVGLIILTGIFEKLGSNEDDTMQLGLVCAKRLSLFLMIYTVFLFPILKRFKIRPFEDLQRTLQNHAVSGALQKKYTLVKAENEERKIAFFSMVSATYFNLLTHVSLSQFQETKDLENPKEESLCYICESNRADAILGECGHGGVCCECVFKLIEKKNECMGCRKPAKAIYKIKNNSRNEAEIIVQAYELMQIIEV